ncbi:MAG: type II toxin-antitoxin system VapC family toxin [Gemmatimonadales bacterium]
MIVADCTLIAQFFLTTPETGFARQIAIADGTWLAPPLWRSELRSVLSKYLLHKDLSATQYVQVMSAAETMLSEGETQVSTADVMNIVAASGCSAYDAEYVSVARSFSIPLVTSDKRLRARFPKIAVSPAEFLTGLP